MAISINKMSFGSIPVFKSLSCGNPFKAEWCFEVQKILQRAAPGNSQYILQKLLQAFTRQLNHHCGIFTIYSIVVCQISTALGGCLQIFIRNICI
jgi:hypothetical protein